MSEKRIQISINLELDLREDEVWPDGPPSDGWGAAQVMAEVEKAGSLDAFLSDWNVTASGAEVDVWIDMDHARGFLQ